MCRPLIVMLLVTMTSASVARAQDAAGRHRGQVLWTLSGAGAGFGVGLWIGLSAFDDAVNSDRKVWTTAIVGAGVGAAAGYLIARARGDHDRRSAAARIGTGHHQAALDPKLLEQLAKSIQLSRPIGQPVSERPPDFQQRSRISAHLLPARSLLE